MRRLEKLIGEAVSSAIILIIGLMIISELAKTSPLIQGFGTVLIILFIFLVIAVGVKIFDYFKRF